MYIGIAKLLFISGLAIKKPSSKQRKLSTQIITSWGTPSPLLPSEAVCRTAGWIHAQLDWVAHSWTGTCGSEANCGHSFSSVKLHSDSARRDGWPLHDAPTLTFRATTSFSYWIIFLCLKWTQLFMDQRRLIEIISFSHLTFEDKHQGCGGDMPMLCMLVTPHSG